MPAILKGWLDRVLLPDVAFLMPDATHRTIRPGLQHIGHMGVFATCGASRILRVIAVGKSNEHLWAKGTLTLTAETALRAWTEIGLSVARAGVRKVLILNSHGGNADLISIVSRELRVRAGMYCVRMGWGGLGLPEGLFSEQEMRHGIHGGDSETSLMLHFAPETVDMTAAQDFRSTAETGPVSPIGAVAYGWIDSDINAHGIAGEAHLATEKRQASGRAYGQWGDRPAARDLGARHL